MYIQNTTPAFWNFRKCLLILGMLLMIVCSCRLSAMDLNPLERSLQSSELRSPQQTLALNSTTRLPSSAFRDRMFRIHLPAAGVLSVHATTLPTWGDGQHELRLTPPTLDPESGSDLKQIRRTPSGWVVKTDRASVVTFSLRSTAEGNTGLKIRNAFVPASRSTGERAFLPGDPPAVCEADMDPVMSLDEEADGTSSTTDDSIDPWDCDVMSGLVADGGILEISAVGPPIRIGVFEPGCATEIHQAELGTQVNQTWVSTLAGRYDFTVDPILGSSGNYSLRFEHYPLCRRGEQDDHGDTADCATPLVLGRNATGRIGNPHGDDVDYFAVPLKTQTVRLEVDSAESLRCRVENAAGHVLSPWQACGSVRELDPLWADDGLRIAVTSTDTLPAFPIAYRLRVVP